MIARKCDRCGKYYDDEFSIDNPNAVMLCSMKPGSKTALDYKSKNIFDLCPFCMLKLNKLLKGEE